jgi:hypothetical protein
VRSFFKKHRVLSFVLGFALAATGGAVAALTVYSGTNGSAPNNAITITQSTQMALTFSSNGTAPALDANASVNVPVKLTNNDATNAHTVSGLTITITGSDTVDNCASHLTHPAISPALTSSVAASGQATGTVTVAADNTIPLACSGSTYTITFAGSST